MGWPGIAVNLVLVEDRKYPCYVSYLVQSLYTRVVKKVDFKAILFTRYCLAIIMEFNLNTVGKILVCTCFSKKFLHTLLFRARILRT